MNPSSSLNADPARSPSFRVSTRCLSADLTTADAGESARDLGTLSTEKLAEVLTCLGAFDPTQLLDADPQVVVTARRGRFFIRPGRGKLILREAHDAQQSYFELPAAEVPSYLDDRDYVPTTPPAEMPAASTSPVRSKKPAVAAALCTIAVLLAGISALFTFRTEEIDPSSDYTPITDPARIAAIRQQVTGTYATDGDEGGRVLHLSADGTVRYREPIAGSAEADERTATYTPAVRRGADTPLLRTSSLGPIEIRDAATVVYARETYTRRVDPPRPPR